MLHVPRGYKSSRKALPVVLNFHGGGGSAQAQAKLSGMNRSANRNNFIVVYPNGTGGLAGVQTFNAGTCCGYASDNNISDVAFASAIIDDLIANYRVNRRRIYATGHSNGGMLAYRLACDLSERIAAVASVAGPLGMSDCHPTRPVSILHFHGTADKCAPINGGAGALPGSGVFLSASDSVSFWIEQDSCRGELNVTYKNGNATCRSYKTCAGRTEVAACTIVGGGHAWPGGNSYPSAFLCGGKRTKDISANEEMWKFFKRHSLR